MRLGFVGSGNMARALALAFDQPALFSDSGSGRAQLLAEMTGGESVSTAEIALRCDTVLLCHKPRQLAEVARELKDFDGTIVSVLAATTLADLRAALPQARILRTMPNIPVESGRGVLAIADESDDAPELEDLFARCGLVLRVAEEHFELVTAIGGCAPAFFAEFARALIESATARGMDRAQAAAVVNQTLIGTGAALAANGVDTQALIDAVASPGGLTERALQRLEESDLSGAVDAAVATVLGQ